MDLTIVIPFCDGHDTLKSLLSSIPSEFPVIIVDDLSKKAVTVKRDNTRIFRLSKKGYFSGAVNFGLKQSSTDVLILNQDVEFKSTTAFDLLAQNKDTYAVIGEKIHGPHPSWPEGYIHGTFMFMRRDSINKVGLLNEDHYPLWGSTCEWQLRACRKGFRALPTEVPGMSHKRRGNYGSSITELLLRNPDKRGLFIRTPPLISVVVPAYNHGKYLPELVSSLIGGDTSLGYFPGQTFQSFDVIIADDCSTDETGDIIKGLADPWKGIKYVRTKSNSGTSAACNLAIRSSHAKYIARIDADDMREEKSLESMLRLQLQNPHSLIYDDVQLFTGEGKSSKAWRMSDYDFDNLLVKNFIHAGIMFPKEAWEEVGGYPEAMRHGRDDWAFNIALGLRGWCGVHSDHVGYLYRRHGLNRTLINTTPKHRADFLDKIISLYPEAYQEVRPMGCCGGGGSSVTRSQTYQRNNGRGGTYTMAEGLPGAKGLVVLEYQGGNYGEETYFGPATGSTYSFSAKKRRRWVDHRDLNFETRGGQKIGLLDLSDNGRPIFRLARQPVRDKIAESAEIASQKTVADEVLTDADVQSVLPEDQVEIDPEAVIGHLSTLRGVGRSTAIKLISHGYSSMKAVAEASLEDLIAEMGWSEDKAQDIKDQALLNVVVA